jgi:hypothetical protein
MRAERQEEARDPRNGAAVRAPSAWARYSGFAAVLIAFVLIVAFYLTVAAASQRAELARRQARLELDRQAACNAFARATDRSLCAVAFAHRRSPAAVESAPQPANDVLSATYRERHVGPRHPPRTAGLY